MLRHKLLVTVAMAGFVLAPAHAQIIGSLGNFDCVNDTGETAEGFEIEIEDIHAADLTREFPSNFAGQEYVNRFGIPAVTEYDNTAAGGHRGVRVTWAASWDGTKWVSKFGDHVYLGVAEKNGVDYVKKPIATQGDSCWLLGQGAGYATSGCDHFGLSFGFTAVLGKTTYHWLVPDKANVGKLAYAAWGGVAAPGPYIPVFPPAPPLPIKPVQVYVPPVVAGQPPVIHAVAEAPLPENPDPVEPQWGKAVWVKTYTSFGNAPANLDALQKNLIPLKGVKGTPVKITWALLQQAPAGVPLEKMEVDDDAIPKGKVAVTKRYEYYDYTGVYDLTTREAICAPELAGGNGPCTRGPVNYAYVDAISGEGGPSRTVREKGKFLGAHMNGYNIP